MKRGFFRLCRALVAVSLCMAAAQAQAVGYNIKLKTVQNNVETELSCITSAGFSFTKTVAGAFPVSSPAISAPANCFAPGSPALNFTTSLNLSAIVVTTSLLKPGTGCPSPYPNPPPATPPAGCQIESLNQGPNVEGLRQTMETFVSGVRYTITFDTVGTTQPFVRTWNVRRFSGAPLGQQFVQIASGNYYVFNVTRAVPEPGTLVLGVLALSLLAAFGWSRRRQSAALRARR